MPILSHVIPRVRALLSLLTVLSMTACSPTSVSTVSRSSAEFPAVRAVLVTGASSGIGRKITERLAAHGYFVYAGARKDSDLRALGALKNVQPIRLDVTDPKEISAAVTSISQAGRGLYGLVNNAGVVANSRILDTKMDEFETVMDVNVYGPWRVTGAFAPLIIAAKGHITNISSINGINAPAKLGAYAMSKHAIEAFTDALAEEMSPQGVQVSVVEPGTYKSEIAANEVRRSGNGAGVASFMTHAKDPEEVAAAVEQSLSQANTKRRYMVVPDEQQASIAIKAQLERLVEMNEGQPYTYNRDTLVKMLDDELSTSRPPSLNAAR